MRGKFEDQGACFPMFHPRRGCRKTTPFERPESWSVTFLGS